MGGHDHGYKIPSPDIYKVEDVPQLKMVQEELAKLGLKDPWLRNEVWRYTGLPGKSHFLRVFKGVTTGMLTGFAAFLVTIGIEQYFGITYGKHHDKHHNNDDHH
ncbi:NADH dehydrogenase [ubiquinone] 1 beta subcomplex subunit 3 [Bombus vancouverensis nearcticus]|uniref:NADH dehydrogenase [ubiquinone] 1 beta subcomplex subunit 3 n=1 Tax=Bombus bifarius TaxID=103933 RepID=A0A6P8MKT5_9HYME|nr:NADH dehydrogenase [ubiquinone] 1 beta subcomplex subunit 3 [Bombus vancouverensis nearcticus]XP_033205098.1 NADH dehydrogenase [ubiquinone] 1 beta subcomplex subunit 3 [Bombus vancouverensis nearcticus]XP_033205100.1 NADH dehydrogenase [ubiquinone] 1 beta subcomplex subunit 3 [Bombus vancouverensis nearcticus]XP_033303223.1 NADH dehydrogenase [ubiquinone] 1 beta subcomplex subunit 3 [Bombus bifarius]XP_033303224.1 NADH dehydrogenase [ubiquinone] 1 beta subcomplex subunit 3 [Bombus bifarius]